MNKYLYFFSLLFLFNGCQCSIDQRPTSEKMKLGKYIITYQNANSLGSKIYCDSFKMSDKYSIEFYSGGKLNTIFSSRTINVSTNE